MLVIAAIVNTLLVLLLLNCMQLQSEAISPSSHELFPHLSRGGILSCSSDNDNVAWRVEERKRTRMPLMFVRRKIAEFNPLMVLGIS